MGGAPRNAERGSRNRDEIATGPTLGEGTTIKLSNWHDKKPECDVPEDARQPVQDRVKEFEIELHESSASFEAAAPRPPQDEAFS
jgi:hypothetical protein